MQGRIQQLIEAEGETFVLLHETLGDEALLALLMAHGGTRIQVPVKARQSCSLAPVIGLPALEKLVGIYQGDRLSLPLGKPWLTVMFRRQGYSYSKIARTLRIGETNVYRTLKGMGMIGGGVPKPRARPNGSAFLQSPRRRT